MMRVTLALKPLESKGVEQRRERRSQHREPRFDAGVATGDPVSLDRHDCSFA
jgi:hypothetical protein